MAERYSSAADGFIRLIDYLSDFEKLRLISDAAAAAVLELSEGSKANLRILSFGRVECDSSRLRNGFRV